MFNPENKTSRISRTDDPEETPFHPLSLPASMPPLPESFTYPFRYTPHPVCLLAAEKVKNFLNRQTEWRQELDAGKMFGVLVVRNHRGETGFLAAFSGTLAQKNRHPFFVPPIYDLQNPESFFPAEEKRIDRLNERIGALENDASFIRQKEEMRILAGQAERALEQAVRENRAAKALRDAKRRQGLAPGEEETLIRESQHKKAELRRLKQYWTRRLQEKRHKTDRMADRIEALKRERQQRSARLQWRLFQSFIVSNARGETKNLCELFADTPQGAPPAGSGECAAPKLLQTAYRMHFTPIAMAEFWWGKSPKNEIREHGRFYPACQGKCGPILRFMLQGLQVDPDPAGECVSAFTELETVYEDDFLAVVNKPAGMLSAPGKSTPDSVYRRVREKYPDATGPLLVHRLDMATSGLLLVAKTKTVHQNLQAQFKNRTVRKRYAALLEKRPARNEGVVDLPLRPDPLNRPYQTVDPKQGKPALTEYKVLGQTGRLTRVNFIPHTGRTHQLRVHAAHPAGLHCPIAGDELYGRKAERLFLHAEYLEFRHPVFGTTLKIEKKADF